MSRAIQSILKRSPLRRAEPELSTAVSTESRESTDSKHQDRMMLPTQSVLMGTVTTADAGDAVDRSDDKIQKHMLKMKLPQTPNAQDDDDSDSNDNAIDANAGDRSRTNSDNAQSLDELRHREKAMHQALEVVCRVAAMDTDQYQTKLVENALPQIPDHGANLNTAHVARLSQSVHKFHASVTNLQHENAMQTTEIQELQAELRHVREHEKQLNRALHKLHRRNQRLKEKLKGKDTIAAKIMHQVQSRVNNQQRKQDEDFLKLATQVQQHELNMVHLQRAARERTSSNFSDMDGLQDFDGASSVGSVNTSQSLFTDDGIASLRIESDRSQQWPPMVEVYPNQHDRHSPLPPGLELPSTPPPVVAPTHPKETTVNSRIGKQFSAFFSGSKVAQLYTLSVLAPAGMQFVKLRLDDEQVKQSPTLNAAGVKAKTKRNTIQGGAVDANGNGMPLMDQDLDGIQGGPCYAFAVCGYNGFDSDTNVKPTFGARLVSIDKEVVPGAITEQELQQWISEKGRTVKLTFRNDTWNAAQREHLERSSQQISNTSPAAADLSNTTTPNAGSQTKTEINRPSFLRQRAASSDATVGAAKANKAKVGFWGFSPVLTPTGTGRKAKAGITPAMALPPTNSPKKLAPRTVANRDASSSSSLPESPPQIARNRINTSESGSSNGSVSSMLNRVRTKSGEALHHFSGDIKKSMRMSPAPKKAEGPEADSSNKNPMRSIGKMFASSTSIEEEAPQPQKAPQEDTTVKLKNMFSFR